MVTAQSVVVVPKIAFTTGYGMVNKHSNEKCPSIFDSFKNNELDEAVKVLLD